MAELEYPWVSRDGRNEARLFQEDAEEVLFFFRRIGAPGRGVAKVLPKPAFTDSYRLKPASAE